MRFDKINLEPGSFGSEITRNVIGQRTIDTLKGLTDTTRSRKDRMRDFRGAVFEGFLDYVVNNLGAFILQSLMTLYQFNWNQTDKEIEDAMKANETVIAGQLGTLAANSLVYMVGGGMLRSAAKRYPALSGEAVAKLLTEEGSEEIASSIRSFLFATRSTLTSNFIMGSYLSYRQMTQGSVTERKEPWSVANALDKLVDSNQDAKAKAFWNNFKDQTEDAIFDMGYLINGGLIAQYEMSKANRKAMLGKERTAVLIPDKNNPENKIWLNGSTENLISNVNNVLSQESLITDKDVGNIVALSPDKAISANKNTRLITFHYVSNANGSTVDPDGRQARRAEIKVSDLKPTTTWQELKTAARSYTRGNYLVTASLDNGHAITVWASNEGEGKDIINSLLPLQKGSILKWTSSEYDPQNIALKKPVELMHIRYAKLRILRPTANPNEINYRDRKSGDTYRIVNVKIPLFRDTEPANLPNLTTGETV